MQVELHPPPVRRRSKVLPRLRLALLGVVVLAAGLAAWQLLGGGDDGTKRAPAAGVSVERLTAFAGTVPHPVYWAGAQPGTKYELSKTRDGRIYVRYLPPDAKVGNSRTTYLTIGTYPLPNALETLKATAKKQGATTISLDRGGLAFQDRNRPTSVYLAYPGSDFQVEVYDRSPARALKFASSGQVAAIEVPGAEAATADRLKALQDELGHPVYWAGAASDRTYELTRTKDGRVFIRYLPSGAHVGDRNADYLSVGTYPQKDAFGVLKQTVAKNGLSTLKLTGGGLAYVDKDQPTSVYAAYPGSDLQIEVYDPSPARARQLVTSGTIAPVR